MASDLLDDFAHCCKLGNQQPADWVKGAKQRFTDPLSQSTALSISVVTEVRDLARSRADQEREAGDIELKELQDLITEFRGAESDLSDTEIRLAQERGARKGIAKFKVELKAEIETVSQLRKQVMGEG
ncbi:MAG: hypothetical protein HC866_21170 [Leptolyngbyaceae cyanobacterium RU_5_1]|nr:hypothetical protein [Leptolyngbyaceae cyanobacterium RU_5_1]